jgi:hypothetical protein
VSWDSVSNSRHYLCTNVGCNAVMGQFSFDIQDSKGLFDKLVRDYNLFLADKTSSDKAINFSITAYHLYEWTEAELNKDEQESLRNKRKQIQEDFQIIRDITNGSKHKDINNYVPKLKTAKKHNGSFSSAFSRGFDITVLLVEMNDGREMYFEDIAERVYMFWNNFFKTDE